MPRRAQIREREGVPRLVQYFLVGVARLAELALQGARAHVEDLRNVLLRGLAACQPMRQHFTHTRLDVLALELRQVLQRNRIVVARQFWVAAVEHPLDTLTGEHELGP